MSDRDFSKDRLLTWGEFKEHVDARVAEEDGDDDTPISWIDFSHPYFNPDDPRTIDICVIVDEHGLEVS